MQERTLQTELHTQIPPPLPRQSLTVGMPGLPKTAM